MFTENLLWAHLFPHGNVQLAVVHLGTINFSLTNKMLRCLIPATSSVKWGQDLT